MTHTSIFTKRPPENNRNSTPTGAINGNGDVCVVWSNIPDGVRVNIAKSDFWKALPGNNSDGGIKVVGSVDILGLNTKNYYAEQRMDTGEIYAVIGGAEIRCFVCAVENVVLIEITDVDRHELELVIKEGCGSVSQRDESFGVEWGTRVFLGGGLRYETAAALALFKLSKEKLNDGRTVRRYAVSVATNHDCDMESYVKRAIAKVREADYDWLRAGHEKWWRDFWELSSVRLYDEEIELNWYASQYIMACCARNIRFPPGLYGNFITGDNPGWHGDLHLNYNYEAPYYGLFSSNHVALSDGYASALEDFVPEARYNAREYLNVSGVYFPVGIGPLGLNTSSMPESKDHGELFLGQKSNAAYAALILIMRWYATYDADYAREHIYPFVHEVADFWEDYLVFEDGRYVIKDDAVHEVSFFLGDKFTPGSEDDYSDDFNNILSLGLVRMVFKCMLDMSTALDIDAERRLKWTDILEHISDFPTFTRKGKRIFRLTEKGMEYNERNSLCIQHIYPAGQIGLGSDNELLETALNTFFLDDRTLDDNGSCSYLPCGARIGVNPERLIKGLKRNYKKYQLPNMLFYHDGGCLEHSGTTASTVNEMLIQSHEDIIRLFPVWDKSLDAEFNNLRADGAFLVSAALSSGEISGVSIVSERGCPLLLQNPFEGGAEVTVNGTPAGEFMGNIGLETSPEDVIKVERKIL